MAVAALHNKIGNEIIRQVTLKRAAVVTKKFIPFMRADDGE